MSRITNCTSGVLGGYCCIWIGLGACRLNCFIVCRHIFVFFVVVGASWPEHVVVVRGVIL